MGRLLEKPPAVQNRAHRMWRWKNRVLVERLVKEFSEFGPAKTVAKPPHGS
jgi:hypothetical protein